MTDLVSISKSTSDWMRWERELTRISKRSAELSPIGSSDLVERNSDLASPTATKRKLRSNMGGRIRQAAANANPFSAKGFESSRRETFAPWLAETRGLPSGGPATAVTPGAGELPAGRSTLPPGRVRGSSGTKRVISDAEAADINRRAGIQGPAAQTAAPGRTGAVGPAAERGAIGSAPTIGRPDAAMAERLRNIGRPTSSGMPTPAAGALSDIKPPPGLHVPPSAGNGRPVVTGRTGSYFHGPTGAPAPTVHAPIPPPPSAAAASAGGRGIGGAAKLGAAGAGLLGAGLLARGISRNRSAQKQIALKAARRRKIAIGAGAGGAGLLGLSALNRD